MTIRTVSCLLLAGLLAAGGCHHGGHRHGGAAGAAGGGVGGGVGGPPYDRPFPLGAVTDAFWETQQTNAEAADFIFYEHEFVGDTAKLTPAAIRHLEQVALRLEHVPFPVVVEPVPNRADLALDRLRKRTIIEQLGRLGMPSAEKRVVIADPFAEGFTAVEGESAYGSTLGGGFEGGAGRRFGGTGGFFR